MKSFSTEHLDFMQLVADESVDFGLIKALGMQGFEITAIIEVKPGINDSQVLDIANAHTP